MQAALEQVATPPHPPHSAFVEAVASWTCSSGPEVCEFFFCPIPAWLRQGRAKQWSWYITLLLSCGTTITVAAQYYCQPLLVELAEDFGVSGAEIASVPTLTQAGNAAAFFLLAPLGDLVKRRQLLLTVMVLTLPIILGLALSHDAVSFKALSFFLGFLTITPQVNGPLILDYAPPERRSSAISLNVAGLLLGLTGARVVSGLITYYASWRIAYWVAFGLQAFILVTFYLCLPDYPRKKHGKKVHYGDILWSVVKSAFTEPALAQIWVVAFLLSWVNIALWTTMSFLLDHVYSYNTLQIGLFGLAGLFLVLCAPLIGRWLDPVAPWYGIVLGLLICIVATAVYTAAAGLHLAALIIFVLVMDFGAQLTSVGFYSKIATIDPLARSRHNSVYMLANLAGGFIGTQVSSVVLLKFGWRVNGAQWLGALGVAVLVCLIRGPHVSRKRWLGWQGGGQLRRKWSEGGPSITTAGASPSEAVEGPSCGSDESYKGEEKEGEQNKNKTEAV